MKVARGPAFKILDLMHTLSEMSEGPQDSPLRPFVGRYELDLDGKGLGHKKEGSCGEQCAGWVR